MSCVMPTSRLALVRKLLGLERSYSGNEVRRSGRGHFLAFAKRDRIDRLDLRFAAHPRGGSNGARCVPMRYAGKSRDALGLRGCRCGRDLKPNARLDVKRAVARTDDPRDTDALGDVAQRQRGWGSEHPLRHAQNANASFMSAISWIERVQGPNGTFLQLQYAQTVLLDFKGLRWPHVSVATLLKTF
jgi:hypothetical protein